MVCSYNIRNVIAQAGHIGIISRRVQINNILRSLPSNLGFVHTWKREYGTSLMMMVYMGASENRGPVVDKHPEKDEDGGYTSEGWKSEDGKLSWGYSSFKGKRATMEDFFDIKLSKVDGQIICLFGIFNGNSGSRATEFLKDHLFENLMKHPKFLMDHLFVHISEMYQQIDVDFFLNLEKDTLRNDGSTTSTALLVGNHLYVVNVGDSHTIISKASEVSVSHWAVDRAGLVWIQPSSVVDPTSVRCQSNLRSSSIQPPCHHSLTKSTSPPDIFHPTSKLLDIFLSSFHVVARGGDGGGDA
ncbi:probable protein phosphatase 2C 76 [Benincasa hispida]|uniref:probable protein phosphatase 2C 76 n=1 Tax=Benincasa hispida TaxID=102211 RepID=UPI0018FF3BDD|nr:probable protein phosphatase 2C 76 [Benincasa hispida]